MLDTICRGENQQMSVIESTWLKILKKAGNSIVITVPNDVMRRDLRSFMTHAEDSLKKKAPHLLLADPTLPSILASGLEQCTHDGALIDFVTIAVRSHTRKFKFAAYASSKGIIGNDDKRAKGAISNIFVFATISKTRSRTKIEGGYYYHGPSILDKKRTEGRQTIEDILNAENEAKSAAFKEKLREKNTAELTEMRDNLVSN